MKEAMLYEKLTDNGVQCKLCNHRCKIPDSKRGACAVRENRSGTLYSLVYGKMIASHLDPIEKKPLYNFYPGTTSYSIATVGCNFRCQNCQNADISQMPRDLGRIICQDYAPKDVVSDAIRAKARTIAYTYTEPTIFFEYAYDIAKLATEKGIKNIFVTNGYMTAEALKTINPYLDAANVDLKSFSDEFYRKNCGARLDPVLESLKLMKQLGIWVEVTTLIIPTMNDSAEELRQIAEFILSLGPETPWHISAFHPTYKLTRLPRTPVETLHKARKIGLDVGLRYVYCGNVPGDEGENTYCYNCEKILIKRFGYRILKYQIKEAKCPYCGAKIDGVGI
ncbi:MAG: AmmeMemoRadiSam system radical SAM enzyme [Candidatus Poribacteria bacterium]